MNLDNIFPLMDPNSRREEQRTFFENQIYDPTPRAEAYLAALSTLGREPSKILEIGTIREHKDDTPNWNARMGDGGSTVYWAEYVTYYGGSLTICDIDDDALKFSERTVKQIPSVSKNIEWINGNGIDHIDNSYDFIFLDGAPGPEETLEQFLKIDREKVTILIDDVWDKGQKVIALEGIEYTYFDAKPWSDLALFDKKNHENLLA